MSPSELQTLDEASLAYDAELKESGHHIMAEALEPVEAAITLWVRNGKFSSTDGPSAETKEHLVGFLAIGANDLNDAVRIASRVPMAGVGSIEVPPVVDYKRRGWEPTLRRQRQHDSTLLVAISTPGSDQNPSESVLTASHFSCTFENVDVAVSETGAQWILRRWFQSMSGIELGSGCRLMRRN